MSERELTMSEALNEALHEEMRRDEKVLVIGEDIAGMGGLFQVTAGLLEQFGARRVIDTLVLPHATPMMSMRTARAQLSRASRKEAIAACAVARRSTPPAIIEPETSSEMK